MAASSPLYLPPSSCSYYISASLCTRHSRRNSSQTHFPLSSCSSSSSSLFLYTLRARAHERALRREKESIKDCRARRFLATRNVKAFPARERERGQTPRDFSWGDATSLFFAFFILKVSSRYCRDEFLRSVAGLVGAAVIGLYNKRIARPRAQFLNEARAARGFT